jgi:hypothetical protein
MLPLREKPSAKESTLWLRDNEDTLLASLTFSVARSNGQHVI